MSRRGQTAFLRNRRIAGVEVLPAAISDEEAIARARVLLSKRKGPFDSFEVWEGSRYFFRERLPQRLPAEISAAQLLQTRPLNGAEPQLATGPRSPAAE
jgi:hypothetical protein